MLDKAKDFKYNFAYITPRFILNNLITITDY
jgi:hypothetical protein